MERYSLLGTSRLGPFPDGEYVKHADVRALEERCKVLEARLAAGHRFEDAPCPICEYNGPGYYQPKTHPCAVMYHAAISKRSGLVSTKEIDDAALKALSGAPT